MCPKGVVMGPPKKTRHGLNTLRRKVEVHGLDALDARCAGARVLQTWRLELIEALGGEAQLSPQQITLIELVTRLKLFLDHTDSYLLALPSLINRRYKKMVPVLKERMLLSGELRATLVLLGLKKIPKLVSSIPPEQAAAIEAVGRELDEKVEKERANGRPESV